MLIYYHTFLDVSMCFHDFLKQNVTFYYFLTKPSPMTFFYTQSFHIVNKKAKLQNTTWLLSIPFLPLIYQRSFFILLSVQQRTSHLHVSVPCAFAPSPASECCTAPPLQDVFWQRYRRPPSGSNSTDHSHHQWK